MSLNYKDFLGEPDDKPSGVQYGYPVPGPQTWNPNGMAGGAFSLSVPQWAALVDAEQDFIVIGTGPTAVAFVDQVLKNNANARVLMLERGAFWLPVHYQNLPFAFQSNGGNAPTTYPWSRTSEMATTGMRFFQAGYIPALGGRSSYWSAWCPSPGPELMRDWPQELVDVTLQDGFWERAREFLHVVSMDTIEDGVYGKLQQQIGANLCENYRRAVPSAEHAYAAPIAVGKPDWQGDKFYKYCTVGALLGLQQQHAALHIADHCVASRLLHDDHGSVIAIETSRGVMPVGGAKVVLAMGTIPPATLLINSFGDRLPNAGRRYTGHFMSHVTARVKRSEFKDLAPLELGAMYLDGKDAAGFQYHVQASAFAAADPARDAGTIAHEAPDAAAVASPQQLAGSQDYVVFVCATLGEVNEKNAGNRIRGDGGADPTTNVSLQLQLGPEDMALWDVLDEATYQTIDAMVGDAPTEFWTDTDDAGNGQWGAARAPRKQIRLPIIVHEASPLWMGTDPATSVVGLDYRPHGVENVYVTGGALFPTSGSWNPTLTMCGLAQDLAAKLQPLVA
jgi:choline dehydrogenase-like flavoprotein